MIFGAIPLALSIMLVWFVPAGLPDPLIFLWIAGTFMIYDTMITLTGVPYYALSSELTQDYDERASLTTVRMIFGVPAYLVGAALTPVIAGLFATRRAGYGVVGIVYGILAAAGLLISAAGIRERPASQVKSVIPPWTSFLYTLQESPLRAAHRRLPHRQPGLRPHPDPAGLLHHLPVGHGRPDCPSSWRCCW